MNHRAHKSRLFLLLAAALLLTVASPAPALVFHPDGEPNLVTWTDRPPQNAIGRWGYNASCVVISSNCVITTQHQGGNINTIVEIDRTKYTIAQIWQHETADLRLVKLFGANLPNFVGIYEKPNEPGREIVIGGYGVGTGAPLKTNGKTYGYEWGHIDSRALRIGTNRIESTQDDNELEGLTSDVIVADFDGLHEGSPTTYETIPAVYDSGGGCFVKQRRTWKLAGLSRAVEPHYEQGHDDDPNHALYESWFRDRSDPSTPDADYFDAVRISSYAQWINDRIPSVLPGDLNGDDEVDIADFSVFARQWPRTDCQPPNPCLGADSEPDGDVDWLDLAQFASHWLTANPPH